MEPSKITKTIKEIAKESQSILKEYTEFDTLPVNYVCIFASSDSEYTELINDTLKIGRIIKETTSGPFFEIPTINSVAGDINIIKIRGFDPSKSGLGYTDFALPDYNIYKKQYIQRSDFKLTVRDEYEFLGIVMNGPPVGVYFMSIPISSFLSKNEPI